LRRDAWNAARGLGFGGLLLQRCAAGQSNLAVTVARSWRIHRFRVKTTVVRARRQENFADRERNLRGGGDFDFGFWILDFGFYLKDLGLGGCGFGAAAGLRRNRGVWREAGLLIFVKDE
jgi:hypothetical protein